MLEYIAKINTVVTPANNTVIYHKTTLFLFVILRWIFTFQFLAFFTIYFIYSICYAFFAEEGLFYCLKKYSVHTNNRWWWKLQIAMLQMFVQCNKRVIVIHVPIKKPNKQHLLCIHAHSFYAFVLYVFVFSLKKKNTIDLL